MAVRWDWEDERPLAKWISVPGSVQYNKLKTISLKTSKTFGCLLYEKTDTLGKSFICSSFRGDANMTKILGAGGSVEINATTTVEIFMNSFGQSALDRTNYFKRVVSLMNSLGYSDCRYNYGENVGTLWFSISCSSQSTYENGLATFNKILCQVFGIQ